MGEGKLVRSGGVPGVGAVEVVDRGLISAQGNLLVDVRGRGGRGGRTIIAVGSTIINSVLVSRFPNPILPPLFPTTPPTPKGDEEDVNDVEYDHSCCFPCSDMLVPEDREGESDGDSEESHVSQEGPPGNLKGLDKTHRPTVDSLVSLRREGREEGGGRRDERYDGDDERRCSDQLSNSE